MMDNRDDGRPKRDVQWQDGRSPLQGFVWEVLAMMWDHGWGWWVFGAVMMLAFWGGLVVVVVFMIRGLHRPRDESPRPGRSDASAILEERFARGEISTEEFDERRRVLERDAM